MPELVCRGCGATNLMPLVDLGMQPLSNAYVTADNLENAEVFYPLKPQVCAACFFVQLSVFQPPEQIFTDYAYLSSFSTTWLAHCRDHVNQASQRLGLSSRSFVVEVASNDGYLLREFVEKDIRVLGIEPAANVADIAREAGVPTISTFFGANSARSIMQEYGPADMMIANNVLAHVPNIHDFIEGFRILLARDGCATFEFPHLAPLIDGNQFDTIYHEHFSYLSLLAVEPIFRAHALRIVDIDTLETHGGSLRLWVTHDDSQIVSTASVQSLRNYEMQREMHKMETYLGFSNRTREAKNELLMFLMRAVERGERVAAYGAAAKGNTLLNYCGVRSDLVSFVVDRNPLKVGTYLPGSRIEISAIERLFYERPNYVLILPWNLKTEIISQISEIRAWGGRFLVAIPGLSVIS